VHLFLVVREWRHHSRRCGSHRQPNRHYRRPAMIHNHAEWHMRTPHGARSLGILQPTDMIPDHLKDEYNRRYGDRTKLRAWGKGALCKSASSPGLHPGLFQQSLLSSHEALFGADCDKDTPKMGSSMSLPRLLNSASGSGRRCSILELPYRADAAPTRQPGLGTFRKVSDRNFEWDIPQSAIAAKKLSEMRQLCPILTSPLFEVAGRTADVAHFGTCTGTKGMITLGEQCMLKFWPKGRASYREGGGVMPGLRPEIVSWATMGIFTHGPAGKLRVRMYIGPKKNPYVTSGPRTIFFDNHMVQPDQILEGEGPRPFKWDDLPNGILTCGIEILENHRDPHLPTDKKLRRLKKALNS